VNGRGLDRRAVANQAIQDVNRFPDATRNEMTEEQDVCIAHMMIGNAPVVAVADMPLNQAGSLLPVHIGCRLLPPVSHPPSSAAA